MKLHFLVSFFCLLLVGAVTPFDSPEFCSQIITKDCNTTFSYIDNLNHHIRPYVAKLVQSPFFRYFKLDLDKQCKFWNAQHFCATENCAVEVLSQYNWSEVTNDDLKPSKLGEINRATDTSSNTCEDLDYCHLDDDHQCVYVDLISNPERFTGYGGTQAFDVWKAIYSENCFPNTNPFSMSNTDQEPEQCVEKNVFYRLISGLHASIAVHLSNEYLDPDTGEFYPNLKVFMERVGKFNDRISNIYFNYALVTQSIVKLNELFQITDFIRKGDENQDTNQKQHILLSNDDHEYEDVLGEIIPLLSELLLFDSSSLFNPSSVPPELKSEFRSRFKNVSAIMDCVGCDRCRMWGKLQTIGYGTALKILFELEDPKNMPLLKFRRIELVALFNTLDRLSKSIEAINKFKDLYAEHLSDVAKGLAQPGVYEVPDNGGLGFPFTPKVGKPKEPEPEQNPFETPIKHQRTFKDELQYSIDEVIDALKFIYQSYVSFPVIVVKYALVFINGWWNVFIGKAEYKGFHHGQEFNDRVIDPLNR